MPENVLYYGDNLEILRRYIKDESVDLIYLDPPFKSDQNYNVLFAEHNGMGSKAQIRAFRGVVEREDAAIGVFTCLREPTRALRSEAAGAGFYTSPGWNKNYPRLQILTVKELLEGKKIDYPPSRHVDVTFKRAPKAKPKETETKPLDF